MDIRNFKIKLKGDKVIWMIFLLFVAISILEVYSTLGKEVFDNHKSPTSMFGKHIFLLLLGTVVLYLTHNIKYKFFSRFSKIGLYVSIALLTVTLLIGTIGGKAAARWIAIPFVGQFQPSEIVKIILIVYIARLLALYQDNIKSKEVFKKLIIPIIIVCLLIFPENFSTAAILFAVCFIMMFIGRVSLKYLSILPIILFGFLFIVFIVNAINPDLIDRFMTWSNRISDWYYVDLDAITQPNLARMAISTGGFFGKFLGNTEQARFLSESHNDFIFAIIIEEGGMIFGVILMALYMILLYRGIIIARRSKGYFGAFCSIGLIVMIVFQAMINMFVATSLTPVTGQTLPFISYGGTSFLFSCVALGIVLSISAEANKDLAKQQLEQDVESQEEGEIKEGVEDSEKGSN